MCVAKMTCELLLKWPNLSYRRRQNGVSQCGENATLLILFSILNYRHHVNYVRRARNVSETKYLVIIRILEYGAIPFGKFQVFICEVLCAINSSILERRSIVEGHLSSGV
jgi:hypothetical protein